MHSIKCAILFNELTAKAQNNTMPYRGVRLSVGLGSHKQVHQLVIEGLDGRLGLRPPRRRSCSTPSYTTYRSLGLFHLLLQRPPPSWPVHLCGPSYGSVRACSPPTPPSSMGGSLPGVHSHLDFPLKVLWGASGNLLPCF